MTARLRNTKYYVQAGEYYDLNAAKTSADSLVKAGYNAIIKDENHNVITQEITFNVGDLVKMQKDAPVYGGTRKFQDWVYDSRLYVREVRGDAIVISVLQIGDITGTVDKKYLTKI